MRVALACLLAVAGLGSCETLDVSMRKTAGPDPAARPERAAPAREAEAEQISLEFDGVALSDVIRMFTRMAGVNIVFDPAIIPGDAAVTAQFTDVPWKPTLDAILEVHGLQLEAVDDEGTVYRVTQSLAPAAAGPVTPQWNEGG